MRIPGLEIDVNTTDVPWRSTQARGVRWLLLGAGDGPPPAGGSGTARAAAVLIEMDPGCGYPPHRHLDVEEVLVLRGGYRDEQGEHRAGDYVRYPAGSVHSPEASGDPARPVGAENPACLLYAIARGGIEHVPHAP